MLACGGFYGGRLDGRFGPITARAEEAAFESYLNIQSKYGRFERRSERIIEHLLCPMQVKARQILTVARARTRGGSEIHVVFVSGTRSYAEQDVLFEKRPKVTNARGGQSNHNFGIAVDVGLFLGREYLDGDTAKEAEEYNLFAEAVKKEVPGIDWGGDWHSFKDAPHFEYHTGKPIFEVRALFDTGKLLRD